MVLRKILVGFLVVFYGALSAQQARIQVKLENRTQNNAYQIQYQQIERDLSKMLTSTLNGATFGRVEEPSLELSYTFSVLEHRNTGIRAALSVGIYKLNSSGYRTLLFRWYEPSLGFTYIPGTPFFFNLNTIQSNLVANAVFFAYVGLGFYADSESINGGTAYFRKADELLTRMQSTSFAGWEMRRGGTSKYRLVYELLNPAYTSIRLFYYQLNSACILMDSKRTAYDQSCIKESLLVIDDQVVLVANSLLLQRIKDAHPKLF